MRYEVRKRIESAEVSLWHTVATTETLAWATRIAECLGRDGSGIFAIFCNGRKVRCGEMGKTA